jgi:glycerophosphoryl diester phosphodiesterase
MIIIGHRGARGLGPENTVLAIQKAREHQVDMIEIDVRVTKNGIPVLSHNREVTDASGGKLRVSTATYDELKAHKPDLATLEEALAASHGETILVEVKLSEPAKPVIAALKAYLASGGKATNIVLGSKSQKMLMALHQAFPDIQTIVIEPWSGVRARWRAHQLGTRLIAMRSWWLWSGFIASVHHDKYQLIAYTMNDPIKVRKWEKYGLYGVVTDYPDRFKHS